MSQFLTTGDVSRLTGEPEWKVRRAVDGIGDFERFGLKRMIPRERLNDIIDGLRDLVAEAQVNDD